MGKSVLARLQDFYESMCNEDWEYTYGFTIGNVSNPGWIFKFDLFDSYLINASFEKLSIQKTEDDWYFCQVKDGVFEASCGVHNLEEVIAIFLDWTEKEWEKVK